MRPFQLAICILACVMMNGTTVESQEAEQSSKARLKFNAIPNLPDPIGVAGPIVGIHNDVLIVAGGANFTKPDDPQLWVVKKQYHDRAWALRRERDGVDWKFSWLSNTDSFRLSQQVAYSAVASTEYGVLCMGGEDEHGPVNRAFLLSWKEDPATKEWGLVENDLDVPDLPVACTAGGAAVVGEHVYLVAGQVIDAEGNQTASRNIYRLSLQVLNQMTR